jgi:HAMP domain-containing protein
VAVLALAAWMLRLSPAWLAAAAAGTLVWGVAAREVGRRWRWGIAAALAAAVSIGGWYQFRLGAVSAEWERVRFAAEERAAAELRRGLDEIFDRDTLATAQAGRAVAGARVANAALFARIEGVRRDRGVTALAVYEPDGSPLVWAGEHRGSVPDSVRAGLRFSSFSAGPLFGYVYFTNRLPDGRVAVAAELLDAHVEAGEGASPYALRFEREFGLAPRFTTPELAPSDSAWDWTDAEGRGILSVVFATLTQERWHDRLATRGRWMVAAAWLVAAILLGAAWSRGKRPWGIPVAVFTASLLLVPLGSLGAPATLFSPIGFVLPVPADPTLGQLLIVLTGAGIWLLSRSESLPLADRVPVWVRTIVAAGALVGSLALVRASVAPGALAAHPAGGKALVVALAMMAALALRALLGEGRGVGPAPRWRGALVLLAGVTAAAIGSAAVLWWAPGRVLPLWTAALWALPFALACAGVGRRGAGRGALLPWALAGWIAASMALPHLWLMHQNARLSDAGRELGRLGTQADPFLDFLLRQFAERVLFFSAEGREGVGLLYQSWVESGLTGEGYEARITLWSGASPTAELRLSDARIPADRVAEILRAARESEEPTVRRFTDSDDVHYLLAVALPDGRTATVAVPPRRHLGRSTALARFLSPEADAHPEEAVSLSLVRAAERPPVPAGGLRWVYAGNGWRSEAGVVFPSGPMHAHLLVPSPSKPILAARALLVQLLVVGALVGLWALARTLCGEPLGIGAGQWRAVWSFRGRLTLALFAFFLLPMAAFGGTAYRALSREVVRTAEAVAERGLAQAGGRGAGLHPCRGVAAHRHRPPPLPPRRAGRGRVARGDRPGALPHLARAAHLPRLRRGRVGGGARGAAPGGQPYLVAYRRLAAADVLASPRRWPPARSRGGRGSSPTSCCWRPLGAALSVILALGVGRALSRPIEGMSQAAMRVGEGDLSVRLPEQRNDEFGRLFRAFNEMVRGLGETQAELVGEKRRTEAIVAEAATGVIALDATGRVALINPRAGQILGAMPEPGERIPDDRPLPAAVADAVNSFLDSDLTSTTREWSEEREVEGRVIRLRLRRLPVRAGEPGAVLVLEDVTARSARRGAGVGGDGAAGGARDQEPAHPHEARRAAPPPRLRRRARRLRRHPGAQRRLRPRRDRPAGRDRACLRALRHARRDGRGCGGGGRGARGRRDARAVPRRRRARRGCSTRSTCRPMRLACVRGGGAEGVAHQPAGERPRRHGRFRRRDPHRRRRRGAGRNGCTWTSPTAARAFRRSSSRASSSPSSPPRRAAPASAWRSCAGWWSRGAAKSPSTPSPARVRRCTCACGWRRTSDGAESRF